MVLKTTDEEPETFPLSYSKNFSNYYSEKNKQ